jgi:hypothetical protein
MSASTTTEVSELEKTPVPILTMAVVYTGGKYCESTFPLASNGATQLGCHFSDCNTKSGAVALFHNAIVQLTTKLSVTTLVEVKPLPASTAQVTLRVPSISTLPLVSTSLRCVLQLTYKSSVIVASPLTFKSLETVTSLEKIPSPVTV